MRTKEIMDWLKNRIQTCYESLKSSRTERFSELHIEGFRSRLDELILFYQQINGISFIDACKKLNINYEEVDTS